MIFNMLLEHREEIESVFGDELYWQKLEGKKSCRISYRLEDVNVTEPEDWKKMKDFQCDAMIRLDKALRSMINKVVKVVLD